jgi:hypothetical protein
MSLRARDVLHRSVLTTIFAAAASFSSLIQAAPLAIGTVEQIDTRNSSIVVMGQKYAVGSVKLTAGSKSYPAMQGARLLSSNALVWIDGELKKDGSSKVASLTVLPELNVPGSTQLFVAGIVKSIDRTGKVKVGTLSIDTSPTIGSTNSSIKVGDTLEFLGVRPVANGALVASALAPLRAQGVGGTGGPGLQGVGGTGSPRVDGVGGTGGPSLQGVGGTGAPSLQGVGGTGAPSLQGVGGTGGPSLQGVGGTGF